ncbi:hypothetical protein C0J52_15405 [Blattella germanica]|nr:hypothetical protein C0J52_15405 [Blattella germanica]
MASPYMVQKVALNSSNSGYHPESQGEIKCCGTTHGNPNYYQCRFAYPNWCPVCETRKTPRCGRRRSKSEGLEADPLRERNRLCETRYDVEHWRKRVVKEYDLCNYQQSSHFMRQNNLQSNIPREVLYHASLPQPMDIDGSSDNKTLASTKKFKEHFLLGNPRHNRNYDNCSVNKSLLLSEVNENPKHLINSYNACDAYGDISPERGHGVGISMAKKLTKGSSDSLKKRGAFCDQIRTEGVHYGDKHNASSNDNHSTPFHGLETKREVSFCGSLGENCHCPSLAQNGDCGGSLKPIMMDSTSMQDRYLHEVEVLRSKLRQLKGGAEGKRLRQRSESEPGAGFGSNGQDSSWEAKRARDDSPDLTENLQCYYSSDANRLPYAQHASHTSISQREHLQMVHLHRASDRREHNTKDDEASISSDSDFADSDRTCASVEDGDSKGEPVEDGEEADDQSVLSSLTTISNDSNTPSVVGETLGSISLNDHAQKKVAPAKIVIEQKGLPPCLRSSLFSHVPPYISFSMHDIKGEALPTEIQRHMKWKLSTITPLVIRRTLVNSGFKLVRKSNDWCGTWGKHMKSLCFKTLKEFQKINHFPGTFQIGRKDRLWKNLYRLMTKFGKKETVKTLWTYLEKEGVDVSALWNSLVDLVIKTIISGESSISQLTKANLVSRYCSYELFGIDVLLDETLKPWLLEVNISPSLHSSSPLDLAVKGPMVRDLLNMAGYQVPNKLLSSQQEEILNSFGVKDRNMSLCFDKRLYTTVLAKEERSKHSLYQQNGSRDEYIEDILKELTPDDVRHLIQSEDELTQVGRFMKIFPTPTTHIYHEFFEAPRYYNMLFDAWETKYSENRQEGIDLLEFHCLQKRHLTIPVPGGLTKSSVSQLSISPRSPSPLPVSEEKCEDKPPIESRRVQSLSSVALYRAARPRSGKMGVVLKPFPRSVYLTRKPKPSTPVKASSSAPATSIMSETEPSSPLRLPDKDLHMKDVSSPTPPVLTTY